MGLQAFVPFIRTTLSLTRTQTANRYSVYELLIPTDSRMPCEDEALHDHEDAITSFTALCGFLPLTWIVAYLNKVPELATLVPQAVLDNFLRVAPITDPSAPVAQQALRDVSQQS